jgi:ASC-1-like (ASCH) protein
MAVEIDQLKLFNKKAEKILKTGFVKHLKEKRVLRISLTGEGNKAIVETILPNQDSIDAFVLTFRFFYRSSERCSFGNLAKLYERAQVSETLKKEFSEVRRKVNEDLDRVFPYEIKGCTATTNRDFFDMVLFGGLAHADPPKAREFDELMRTPIVADMVQFTFCKILGFMFRAIICVAEINNRAIGELEKHEQV